MFSSEWTAGVPAKKIDCRQKIVFSTYPRNLLCHQIQPSSPAWPRMSSLARSQHAVHLCQLPWAPAPPATEPRGIEESTLLNIPFHAQTPADFPNSLLRLGTVRPQCSLESSAPSTCKFNGQDLSRGWTGLDEETDTKTE